MFDVAEPTTGDNGGLTNKFGPKWHYAMTYQMPNATQRSHHQADTQLLFGRHPVVSGLSYIYFWIDSQMGRRIGRHIDKYGYSGRWSEVMDLVLDGELDDVYICIVADLYVNLILLNLFTRIYMYIYDICVERDQGLCVVRCSHGERDIYI